MFCVLSVGRPKRRTGMAVSCKHDKTADGVRVGVARIPCRTCGIYCKWIPDIILFGSESYFRVRFARISELVGVEIVNILKLELES